MTQFWTNHEVAAVRQHYGRLPRREVEARLPRWDWSEIRRKAGYLGVLTLPVDTDQLRRLLLAESYFIDRAARGQAAAQQRFTR